MEKLVTRLFLSASQPPAWHDWICTSTRTKSGRGDTDARTNGEEETGAAGGSSRRPFITMTEL